MECKVYVIRCQGVVFTLQYITLHSFIHSFIHPFIHTFIRCFVHSFIHSSMHAFIHSFTHSFIQRRCDAAVRLKTIPSSTRKIRRGQAKYVLPPSTRLTSITFKEVANKLFFSIQKTKQFEFSANVTFDKATKGETDIEHEMWETRQQRRNNKRLSRTQVL